MISINYTLIVVFLNFVFLLIVLNKILYKPIKKFLLERQKKISEDIDKAKESRENAENLVQKKEKELKISAEEIRKMKKIAKKDAEIQASGIIKQAKEQEKKIVKETEDQLIYEHEKVVSKVREELADMIASLSEKFLSTKIDEKKDDELLKKILSEREDN
ncbi:MAG: F0F1 ATP synthase subunit B [Candidatus Cloacimonetes bacterium]|nr:F0F1 ATP synthase subunit B [Candidatus Cloacimonadota bacterium]